MRRYLLPNTDLKVSALCCGGGNLGTVLAGAAMDRFLDAFRDAGGNFIDTAHVYSFWVPRGTGASELAIGDYLRRRGGGRGRGRGRGRHGMIVATKGGCRPMPGYRRVDEYLAPARISADIDDSLGRLGLEMIDFYWLHRDDSRLDVGTIIDGLNAEVKRGRIRYLGASNWTAKRFAAANAYAAKHGLRGFSASQSEWSLGCPNAKVRDGTTHFVDAADLRWHERTQIPAIPYTPTAGGYFAMEKSPGHAGFDNAISRARRKRALKMAAELGRSPNQVGLAYLTSHPFPVIPIIGTRKVGHLRDAVKSLELRLTPDQITWLREG